MIDRPFRGHTLEPMSLTEFDQHINLQFRLPGSSQVSNDLVSPVACVRLTRCWLRVCCCVSLCAKARLVVVQAVRLYWILAIVAIVAIADSGYRGDYNGITIGLHFQLSPGLMWQSGAGYILVCRAVFRSDMLTCTTRWLRILYDTFYNNCQLFHTFTPMGGFVTKDPKDYQFLRSLRISIPISAC